MNCMGAMLCGETKDPTYGLCAGSDIDDLGKKMLCELGRRRKGKGKETADPTRKLGYVIAVEAPSSVDDFLHRSVAGCKVM